MTIRNTKNKKQEARAQQKYLDLLNTQAQLNQAYTDAVAQDTELAKMGVTPVPDQVSQEERLKDAGLQRSTLAANLKGVMDDPREIEKYLTQYVKDNTALMAQINSNFSAIQGILKGRKNVTASLFGQIVAKYLADLRKPTTEIEDLTRVVRSAAARQAAASTRSEDLLEQIRDKNPSVSDLKKIVLSKLGTDQPVELERLTGVPRVSGRYKKEQWEQVAKLLRSANLEEVSREEFQQQQGAKEALKHQGHLGDLNDQIRGRKMELDDLRRENSDRLEEQRLRLAHELTELLNDKELLVREFEETREHIEQYEEAVRQGTKRLQEMGRRYAQLERVGTTEARTERANLVDEATRLHQTLRQYNNQLEFHTGYEEMVRTRIAEADEEIEANEQNSRLVGEERRAVSKRVRSDFKNINRRMSDEAYQKFRNRPRPGTGYVESKGGSGLVRHAHGLLSRHRRITGTGLATPRYAPFGRYTVHLPSLRYKGVINVKYPSQVSVPHIPKAEVSDTFVRLVEHALETDELDRDLLDRLTDKEKEFFMRLCRQCHVDLGMGKDLATKEREQMRRWNLLSGELEAGNNAPELLRELRSLTVALASTGCLVRRQADALVESIDAALS